MQKTLKRRCKICKEPFKTTFFNRWWCSLECGVKLALLLQQKAKEKAQIKRKQQEKEKISKLKQKLKTKQDYIKEAQVAVNHYVRLRDQDKGCISCGVSLVNGAKYGGGFDAGHYRSRGSSPHLRFYSLNIFGQCKRCNRYLGGNYANFRIGLIARLGEAKVQQIESDQRARHYSIEDLIRIKHLFKQKAKRLKRR